MRWHFLTYKLLLICLVVMVFISVPSFAAVHWVYWFTACHFLLMDMHQTGITKEKDHTFSSRCCWLRTIWRHFFLMMMHVLYVQYFLPRECFFSCKMLFVAELVVGNEGVSQRKWLCFRLLVWLSSVITHGLYLLSHSLAPPLETKPPGDRRVFN